ncbi:MAG: DUF58 domain-containing protein [Myxococcales bacterium]|nr:DUF58 domain-containing protein [Myxococcales bacterium]
MAAATAALFDERFLKKLEYLHVVAKKVFAGRIRAERRSRKTGSGVEFADHRDYVVGDDLRYLDWGVYGRLGRLLIRLFEEEEDLHIYLLLDTSASMRTGSPPKIDYARQVVAALAYVGLANLDRISIIPLGSAPEGGARGPGRLPPTRGKGRIFKVFDFLRAVEPSGLTDLHGGLQSFVHQVKRRGVAVVVSDFYDPAGYEAALNLLRYHRFEPFVLQLVDPREAEPKLLGDLEIIDCETGEVREITVSPRLCAAFAREHRALCEAIESFCSKRGIPYLRADTAVPFDELILRVFREGGFLR